MPPRLERVGSISHTLPSARCGIWHFSPVYQKETPSMMLLKCRSAYASLLGLFICAHTLPALATEVALVGRIGSRAILSIDGGTPITLAVGAKTREGIRLLVLDGDRAVVEVGGRRQHLELGTQPVRVDSGRAQAITLYADPQGHFSSEVLINRARVPFIVDTGATLLSLAASDATRAGIDFRSGEKANAVTAAGVVDVWRVKVERVQFGPFTFHGVEAAIFESGLPVGLLGMNVLNRLEMRREGQMMRLERHY